ncbi:hypothetical protein KW782_02575 [Candidatus Parcubacteria bacterium]|nr:hypothetical protein [Candidatus Parcubacteria bacterium]
MATTHDMRYDERNDRPSTWSWLLPLALLVLGAIALATYLANDNNTQNSIDQGANTTVPSTLNTPAQ